MRAEFPDDAACLEFIFDAQHSRVCSCGGHYHPISGRKQYQCSKCRFQVAPTAGTIFHKSDTALTLWFHAILAFSSAKSGLSAKELEREIEVTYKTAWRMLMLIRKALGDQGKRKLKGEVETDLAYMGGRGRMGKDAKYRKEVMASKPVVMGAVERNGEVRLKVVPDGTANTHKTFLREHIESEGTRLMTDKANRYDNAAWGYKRESVDHGRKEYVRGDVYINTVEGFFGHVKRSIKGTHKAISKKHLQAYLDGFVFHRNNADSDKARFAALLGILSRGATA